MTDVTPTHIAERVVEAILAQKLAPGERLGEQAWPRTSASAAPWCARR